MTYNEWCDVNIKPILDRYCLGELTVEEVTSAISYNLSTKEWAHKPETREE